jgi:hypothetical protein
MTEYDSRLPPDDVLEGTLIREGREVLLDPCLSKRFAGPREGSLRKKVDWGSDIICRLNIDLSRSEIGQTAL